MSIESIERLHQHMKNTLDESHKTTAICMVAMWVVGVAMGLLLAWSEAKTNAVKQSCGFYDSRTGEFKWGQP
jgi:hypothetical protein